MSNKLIEKAKFLAKKNAPVEFTLLAIAGVLATAYFSGKETLNAEKKLKEAEEKNYAKQKEEQENKGVEPEKVVVEELSKKEKLKIVAPCYKKTAAAVIGTGLCAGAAWKVSDNRIKGAVGAYTGMKACYEAFKGAVDDNIPKKQKDKITAKTDEELVRKVDISATPFVETGHGNLPFIFLYTKTPFHCNYEWIQKVQDELNSNDNPFVTLNDITYALGLEEYDTIGDILGFERNSPDDEPVKFDLTRTTKLADGTPVTIVTFYDVPVTVPEDLY